MAFRRKCWKKKMNRSMTWDGFTLGTTQDESLFIKPNLKLERKQKKKQNFHKNQISLHNPIRQNPKIWLRLKTKSKPKPLEEKRAWKGGFEGFGSWWISKLSRSQWSQLPLWSHFYLKKRKRFLLERFLILLLFLDSYLEMDF